MARKTIIVHPSAIEYDLKRTDLYASHDDAREALRIIGETIASAARLVVTDDLEQVGAGVNRLRVPVLDGDVYVLKEDNPAFVQDCVSGGDHVTLMGAYTGVCLKIAEGHLEKIPEVTVTMHPKGAYDRKT